MGMFDQQVIDQIIELHKQGFNNSKIARKLNIARRSVIKYVKKYRERNNTAAHVSEDNGINFDNVSHYWLKTKNESGNDVSLFVKNQQDVLTYEEVRDQLIEDLKQYAPTVKKIKRQSTDNNHLLVLDPADVHFGKLSMSKETGEEYNLTVAYKKLIDGVSAILQQAESFGIEKIVVVAGNDILHVDNTRNTTTSGTPQDMDGKWWEMFEVARKAYVEIIDMCKAIADVTIVYCPSNHDKVLGFTLIDSLYSWYRLDENVTITNYGKSVKHRKYILYGNNLIGFTHGDGARNSDLSNLMQYEARSWWGSVEFTYWYVHHLHHKYRLINNVEVEKDQIGTTVIRNANNIDPRSNCFIECIRSPSPADSWHYEKGFLNKTAIEGFIHHYKNGQVARLTSYV